MDERWRRVKNLFSVPDFVDGYPPPTPPLSKKSDIFKASDYDYIDQRAKAAPDEIAMTWEGLHSYLFKGLTNDIQKVRALFMWVGSRTLLDIWGVHYKLDAPAGSPYALLKELAGNSCLEIAQFFAHLCRSANLHCVVLHGNEKFETSFDNDHWISVNVAGSWRLVKTSKAFVGWFGSDGWTLIEDRGKPKRDRSFGFGVEPRQISPDEDSFLMDPELSIYSSFPLKDNAWQLLPKPWTLEAFMNTPKFFEAYHRSSWQLAKKQTLFVKARGGKCRISFDKIPEKNRGIKYKLFFNEAKSKGKLQKGLQLTNYVIIENTLTTQSLVIRLPVIGVYKINIFDNDMNQLCVMGLNFTGKIGEQKPFPDNPEKGFGFSQEAVDSGLVDASREEGLVVAREGEKVRFKFRTSQPLDVQARLVHRFLQSQELESRVTQAENDDTVTVTVKIPYHAQNPEFTLQVNAKDKDSETDFMNVLNYLLTPDKQLVYLDKGQAKQVSDELSAALKDDDIYRLESAVREFGAGSNAYGDSGILSQAFTKLGSLHTTAIKNALASKNIDKIKAALNEANASEVAHYMHQSDVFKQARDTLRRLRRLASVRREAKELSGSQVSDELSAALKGDDIYRLESAVREFRAGSNAYGNSGILSQAYTKLKSLHPPAIKNALASKNIDKIKAALNEANASVVAYYIHQSYVFHEAQYTLRERRLRRLASVRHEVKELSGSQVSEVQSYNHPHPDVRVTVVATFVLLGENEKRLKKNWNVVQSLLRSHGKQSILYRIQSYDATKGVDPKRLQSAATLLASVTAEEVRSLSIGVAAFYNWSKAVVDSTLEENNEEPVNT